MKFISFGFFLLHIFFLLVGTFFNLFIMTCSTSIFFLFGFHFYLTFSCTEFCICHTVLNVNSVIDVFCLQTFFFSFRAGQDAQPITSSSQFSQAILIFPYSLLFCHLVRLSKYSFFSSLVLSRYNIA